MASVVEMVQGVGSCMEGACIRRGLESSVQLLQRGLPRYARRPDARFTVIRSDASYAGASSDVRH